MIHHRRFFLTALAATTLLPSVLSAQAAPIYVVATTGMIADTVRRIGGDHVTVRGLMGPGVDPHAYRQTRSDIVAMTQADIVLWHGLYLEAQMEEFFERLEETRMVVAAASEIPADRLLSHDTYENRFDPHVWMDPGLWQDVAATILRSLQDQMPDHADALAQNAAEFSAELTALDHYATEVLSTVPKASRVLLTAHDAFGYFGAAYGFEVMGIQGISTESEAGLRRISDLVEMLVSRDIGAVFVESSVSDRNMRAVIEGAAARGHKVVVGGELFSDAMGPQGSYEGSYIGMIDHNVTTIAAALGGQAPARGMSGRLGMDG